MMTMIDCVLVPDSVPSAEELRQRARDAWEWYVDALATAAEAEAEGDPDLASYHAICAESRRDARYVAIAALARIPWVGATKAAADALELLSEG